MTVLVLVIVVFAGVAGLAYFGLLPGQPPREHTGQVLRDLLRDRADGKIDETEFLSRQAALHAAVMTEKGPQIRVTHGFARWALPLGIVAVTGGIVAVTATFYARPGSPEVVDVRPTPLAAPAATAPAGAPAATGGDMHAMVRRLAEKMEKDASNGEGWLLLARAYVELRQHSEAASAYAKAAALLPAEPGMLANWADAHVLANDRKWDDEARGIVKRALAADPKNLKALALAGTEAFERASYDEAIAVWQRMLAAAPAGSMDAKLAEANIQEATTVMSGAKAIVALPGSAAAPLPAQAASTTAPR